VRLWSQFILTPFRPVSFLKSYMSLSRQQRIGVGVFGIVTSLLGIWFTENKLNIGDRERLPLGMVERPRLGDEKQAVIRLAPKRGHDDDKPQQSPPRP
jgi:hypothetical protein